VKAGGKDIGQILILKTVYGDCLSKLSLMRIEATNVGVETAFVYEGDGDVSVENDKRGICEAKRKGTKRVKCKNRLSERKRVNEKKKKCGNTKSKSSAVGAGA
jgi:hypothetical protein